MSKDPAFLFYSQDFYTGTIFFTDEQVGKYIRILCLQHQTGHLEEKHMMNICKTYDKDIFSKFIRDEKGLYYNERLDIEINRRVSYCESRRKNKLSEKTYVKHMETETKDVILNGGVGEIKKISIEESSVNFYKLEVDKAKSFVGKITDEYINLARHICQRNEDGTFRMSLLLKVKKQLSLNDFCKLYESSKGNIKSITEKIDSFETNISYHKKYNDIYLCINKWMAKDNK